MWNALANRYFKRRDYETPGSDPRWHYLLKAIQAAGTVLKYDAEDVEAHDLLKRCYSEIAVGIARNGPAQPLSAEDATSQLSIAADVKQSAGSRIQSCMILANGLPGMPAPRLAPIREVIAQLRPAFQAETDANVRSAIAAALSIAHQESHAIFKPDEIAQANATRIYRDAHPEANYAARARVIYPTTPAHRVAIRSSGDLPPVK